MIGTSLYDPTNSRVTLPEQEQYHYIASCITALAYRNMVRSDFVALFKLRAETLTILQTPCLAGWLQPKGRNCFSTM